MALIDQATAAAQRAPSTSVAPAAPDAQRATQSDGSLSASTGTSMSEQDIATLQQGIEAKIPANLQDAYQRVMVAGQKVLYSKGTSGMLMEEIQSSEPVDKKLAGAAAGLMTLLDQQSKGTIPRPIYVPAGAGLLLDIAQVMVKGGQDVTDQNVRDGLDQFSALVMTHNGVPPDQVQQAVSGGSASPAPDSLGPAGPATPPVPATGATP